MFHEMDRTGKNKKRRGLALILAVVLCVCTLSTALIAGAEELPETQAASNASTDNEETVESNDAEESSPAESSGDESGQISEEESAAGESSAEESTSQESGVEESSAEESTSEESAEEESSAGENSTEESSSEEILPEESEEASTPSPSEDEGDTGDLPADEDANKDGYHDEDVADINEIIDENGLQAQKDKPQSWDFATWNDSSPKRIKELDVSGRGLTGWLSTYLPELERLDCSQNRLTKVDKGQARWLDCSENLISGSVNFSGLDFLDCSDNQIERLYLSYESDGTECRFEGNPLTLIRNGSNTILDRSRFRIELIGRGSVNMISGSIMNSKISGACEAQPEQGYVFKRWEYKCFSGNNNPVYGQTETSTESLLNFASGDSMPGLIITAVFEKEGAGDKLEIEEPKLIRRSYHPTMPYKDTFPLFTVSNEEVVERVKDSDFVGAAPGTYVMKFRLKDPEKYRWANTEGDTVSLTWYITDGMPKKVVVGEPGEPFIEGIEGTKFPTTADIRIVDKKQKIPYLQKGLDGQYRGESLVWLKEVQLVDGYGTLQPEGKFLLRIPLDDTMKAMTDLRATSLSDDNSSLSYVESKVEGDELVLSLDTLGCFGIVGKGSNDDNEDGYHDEDVAGINRIIDENGLEAQKDNPQSWDFATWNDSDPKQITELKLKAKGLTGSLDISGLMLLKSLDCSNNQLTAIVEPKSDTIRSLNCADNRISGRVQFMGDYDFLDCSNNQIELLNFALRRTEGLDYRFGGNPIIGLGRGFTSDIRISTKIKGEGTVKLSSGRLVNAEELTGTYEAQAAEGYEFKHWLYQHYVMGSAGPELSKEQISEDKILNFSSTDYYPCVMISAVFEKTGAPAKIPVQPPKLSRQNYLYTGKEISPVLTGFDEELMAFTGGGIAMDAGRYHGRITLKDTEKYCWDSPEKPYGMAEFYWYIVEDKPKGTVQGDPEKPSIEGLGDTQFSPLTEIVVEDKAADIPELQKKVEALAPGKSLAALMDIKLVLEGENIQPGGKIKLRIPLSSEMKAMKNLQGVYLSDDGNLSLVDTELEGDFAVLLLEHLSAYGIIATSTEPSPGPTETPVPTEQPKPTDSPAATEQPKPTDSPAATEQPKPTDSPAETEQPEPTDSPAATEQPGATSSPTATAKPAGPSTGDSVNTLLCVIFGVSALGALALGIMKKKRFF